MNPNTVAQNRTARLVAEAVTPVYSTSTESALRARLDRAERALCTDEFCFVCGRCTDHFGEHSDEQLLRAYRGA